MGISMRLPFGLEALLPSGEEEVEVVIVVNASEEDELADEESMKSTAEVVNLFALAVNEQMFSRGKGKPVPAHMILLEKKWVLDPGARAWRFRFQIKSVPPASFLVLLALLTQTHYAYEPLKLVSLRATTQLQNPVDHHTLMNMDRNVPKRIAELSFRVDDAGRERRKNITVIFEFKSRLAREFFNQLKGSLNIWDHLTVLSGFHLDFKEVDSLPNFGSTGHISPFVVTHSVDYFDGYSSAFEALINLGARLHAEGHILDNITIE